jgi:hypothetical protein
MLTSSLLIPGFPSCILYPSLLIHSHGAGLTRPRIRSSRVQLSRICTGSPHLQQIWTRRPPKTAILPPRAVNSNFQQSWQQQSYSRGLAAAHDSAPEPIYEESWCGEEIRTTVMLSAPVGPGPLSIGALIRFGVSHSVSMSRVIKIRSDRGRWPDVIGLVSALTKDKR